MKKQDKEPIQIVVLNPEALDAAKEKVTKYCYEKYIEMKSSEKRNKNI
ncbi:hypothetical protein [Clostridium oryzae]|uniref:Uncharacterized protein n=1 Tax=Clostridium oryzae TaxID=1450648 RepID=A0A1V4IMV5_9CLOT|nr:hypothetical protein [Clostridium oryzae]OPJ61174.1 hypothetical protein CLORY_23860 [Clostridium oryzae]